MDYAPYDWEEVVPQGSIQHTSISGSPDAFRATLTFRIAWDDVPLAIIHLLGYGQVLGTANNWQLSREIPARHPKFPWLRLTQILSIFGRAGKINGTFKRVSVGDGLKKRFYGSWDTADITVLFESPRYSILDDLDTPGNAEYNRYTEKIYETNVEVLARRGEAWNFCFPAARSVTQNYPGDLLVKQPKGKLILNWHDVPEDWIMLGKLIPSNLINGTGKVNKFSFPTSAFSDQNFPSIPGNPGVLVQFPAGSLLLEPVKLMPRTQINEDILQTNLTNDQLAVIFPRTYDVGMSMIHFDPPTEDTTTVTIKDRSNNNANIAIRGHNLVPLPRATANGYRWYAATTQATNGVLANVASDDDLLYQYYDFEMLFSFARSPFGTNGV